MIQDMVLKFLGIISMTKTMISVKFQQNLIWRRRLCWNKVNEVFLTKEQKISKVFFISVWANGSRVLPHSYWTLGGSWTFS